VVCLRVLYYSQNNIYFSKQHRLAALGKGDALQFAVTSPALHYFSTLFHKRYDFRKQNKIIIGHKTCVLITKYKVDSFKFDIHGSVRRSVNQ